MPHLEQDVHEAFFFFQEALIAELTSATVVGQANRRAFVVSRIGRLKLIY